MTNETKHLLEDKTKDRPNKRETVAAFYARMTAGLRRRMPTAEEEPSVAPPSAVHTANGGGQIRAQSDNTNTHDVADHLEHGELEPEQKPGPRSEMEWNDLISHRIDEAMRNGAFDNLRNKGKPLPQDYNPHVPEDRRMANDLLKSNGLAPQWIGDRTAILHVIETFRTKFRTVALRYHTAWHAESTDVVKRQELRKQWATQLETWQDEIRALNRRIEVVNLQQPIARLEIFKLLLHEELKRVGMTRELG